jgi:putative NIF3 family GTP cyclohydrolase 1 type 2
MNSFLPMNSFLTWVLLTVCAASLTIEARAESGRITSRQVIERIQKNVGVPWREQTVDTFKAGDPDAPITGVAVTMMATYDVLQRAAASGKKLIITHEPTFYGHFDRTEELEAEKDPVYATKAAFIKKHGLVVWRFHDHWHLRRPDGILTGMVRTLGWQAHENPANPQLFTLPETSLERLAGDLKKRLGVRTMRVVGDPRLKITKVALSPGASGSQAHRRLLKSDDVEVLVIGEAPEWETTLYADDASAAKQRKALIILGHIPSEQAGMEECARWLKTFVTEVPVEFIPAAEPFWRPR